MRFLPTVFFLMLFAAALPGGAAAQGRERPTIDQLQRRMLEMHRQMMQEFQNNPFFSQEFTLPGADSSSFFFRIDTTFSGPGDAQSFFRAFPFGDRAIQQFFGFDAPDPRGDRRPGEPEGDDGLLPEERLRLEKKAPDARAKAKKPDLKTIRI